MDQIDKNLIALLKMNARLPISALAAKMGMARTTVQARLSKLEHTGVIAGYSLRLGDGVGNAAIKATVLLQLDPRAGPAVISHLKSIPNIEEAFTASGRFDLILTVSAATPARLDAILDELGGLKGVKSSESLIQLSTKIKRG